MHRCFTTGVLLLLCSATALPQCEQRIDGPPNFRIGTVNIEGLEPLPRKEAAFLRTSIAKLCFNNANELAERARDLLQRRGYFKAAIEQPKVVVKDDSRWPARADVLLAVAPGVQYRLREITFSGNKTLSNSASLRALFLIHDGDVLDTSKLRAGVRRLKDAYGQFGFVDFTPIPDFRFDEQNGFVTAHIDIDEGPQFIVEQVDIHAPVHDAGKFVDSWYLRVGDIYNSRAVSVFFERNRRRLTPGASVEHSVEIREDRQRATVVLHVNLCSSDQDCQVAYVPCRSDMVCAPDAAGIPRFVKNR